MKRKTKNAVTINWSAIHFDQRGLVPAITQDAKTRKVLMLGYVNRQSLQKTLATRRVHYYSRKRRSLWLKGETSGHFQDVVGIYLDCDGDTLLFQVRQHGVACHEGYATCFFKKLSQKGKWPVVFKKPARRKKK